MNILINPNESVKAGDLKIGDEVILPSPSWLSDVNPTWTGTVTKLESDYDGHCVSVISKVEK